MRTRIDMPEQYSVLVRGAHRWLWLVGIAILAYLVGFLFVVIFFGGPWGPTPFKDFTLFGALYVFLVAPASYVAFSMVRRAGAKVCPWLVAYSLIGYGLLGACCGIVPALLLLAVTGGEGVYFAIIFAEHGIPAGAVLGLGYAMTQKTQKRVSTVG